MKSLVIYYSHYGNTAIVANRAWAILSKIGDSDIFELAYAGGKKNLFTRALYRIFPAMVKLDPIPYDMRDYDVLYLGIPVLTAHLSSAISKYLQSLKNINNKKIICCYVYGIESSAKRSLGFVSKILQKKGEHKRADIFIFWLNAKKEEFVDKEIDEAISKLR